MPKYYRTCVKRDTKKPNTKVRNKLLNSTVYYSSSDHFEIWKLAQFQDQKCISVKNSMCGKNPDRGRAFSTISQYSFNVNLIVFMCTVYMQDSIQFDSTQMSYYMQLFWQHYREYNFNTNVNSNLLLLLSLCFLQSCNNYACCVSL